MSDEKPMNEVLNDVLDETLAQIKEKFRKPLILSVDDSPVVLRSISTALSKDYDVFTMSESYLVEKYLREMKPDMIILDYKMPGLNGFDLVPIIRKIPWCEETPIIFLTSMGSNDFVSAAASLGACDFIIKPFHANTLREKVAKHIVHKSKMD